MPIGRDCEFEDHAACVIAMTGEVDDPDAFCAALAEETEEACGAAADDEMSSRQWTGPITIEGAPTGDGRMLEHGSVTWDEGPWPVIWDRQDGDHSGMVVGHATRIWRDSGGLIMAEGVLAESEDAETQAAVARVAELLKPTEENGLPAVGVSVMLDDEQVEVRVRADLMERDELDDEAEPVAAAAAATDSRLSAVDRAAEWLRQVLSVGARPAAEVVALARTAGHAEKTLRRAKDQLEITSEKNGDDGRWTWTLPDALTAAADDDGEMEQDEDGRVVVAKWRSDDELFVTTQGRVRHIAIVDTPAFADARIALVASLDLDAYQDPAFGATADDDPRLVRQDPERPGERVAYGAPLTVTDDGRVFGHAALWGRCHAGFGDRCTVAPRNGQYGRFLSGSAVPGVATGPITVGTTHATLAASPGEAMRHYSDTGRAVADVAVGEDAHGIWVSGRIRPGTSKADVAALKGSPLSGDWRWLGGQLRLVGLLAVNQPGFLVQRAMAASIDADLDRGSVTFGPCNCDSLTAAAHGEFSGAVVTLLPSADDAQRLAQDGFEPADALHVTLAWMGDAEALDDEQRALVLEHAAAVAAEADAFTGTAFAHAVFNPGDADPDRDPASVLLLQAPELAVLRDRHVDLDASEFPVWFPHLTVGYNFDGDLDGLVGEVRFDRLAVSFGSEDTHVFALGDDSAEPTTAGGGLAVADGDGDFAARFTALEELVAELLRKDIAGSV